MDTATKTRQRLNDGVYRSKFHIVEETSSFHRVEDDENQEQVLQRFRIDLFEELGVTDPQKIDTDGDGATDGDSHFPVGETALTRDGIS